MGIPENTEGGFVEDAKLVRNRRRALLNLVVSPVALLIIVGVVYMAWKVVLEWASSDDPGTKLALLGVVALFFALELSLIYATLRFMWWALRDIIRARPHEK